MWKIRRITWTSTTVTVCMANLYGRTISLTGHTVHRTLKAFRQEWSKIKGTASYQTGLDILDALVAQPQLHLADFEVPFGDVVDTKGLNPDTLIWVDLNVSSDFRAVDLATRQITDIDSETWTSLQWRNTPDTPSADNRWITVLDLPATESGLGRIILKAPPGTTDFVTQPGRCEQHEWTCGTAMCPAGAITHAHWDYMGASTVCAHLSGRKLWCFWPYTPENSEFLLQCNEPGSANTIKCIRNLTGLRLMFFENKPTAFCVPPFTIHAVLTLTSATHFGGPTYEWKHAHEAVDRIEHSLKTSIPGLTAAYRLVLCEEIDACLGLWAECAASAKSPSITSAERTSFRQRCLELQRLARVG